jgi:NifB/MoaA-like Fe-S oxidoreductase
VSLRWLAALLDAGITVHGQIVVCPDANDGAALDDTLLGILDRYPGLETVAVVPVGVGDHSREESLRAHTPEEARRVLTQVRTWQARFLDALGRRVVYAADEYYLLAGEAFPDADAYDGFAQHENGIGMARTFLAEAEAALAGRPGPGTGPRPGFFAWVDGAPADGYRAPRATSGAPAAPGAAPVAILTGEYGAAVLTPLLPALTRHAGVPVRVLPVRNRFFGGNIAVTGLLTGADVADALEGAPADHRYLLPDVVLSRDRFLDDRTVADLPRPVELVATDGASLVAALA